MRRQPRSVRIARSYAKPEGNHLFSELPGVWVFALTFVGSNAFESRENCSPASIGIARINRTSPRISIFIRASCPKMKNTMRLRRFMGCEFMVPPCRMAKNSGRSGFKALQPCSRSTAVVRCSNTAINLEPAGRLTTAVNLNFTQPCCVSHVSIQKLARALRFCTNFSKAPKVSQFYLEVYS